MILNPASIIVPFDSLVKSCEPDWTSWLNPASNTNGTINIEKGNADADITITDDNILYNHGQLSFNVIL